MKKLTIEDLMQLDLPVLEAMLATQIILVDKACTVARGTYEAVQIEINLISSNNEKTTKQFCFPEPGTIPAEIIAAFQQLADRVCAEKWLIEVAIENKKELQALAAFQLSLSGNNN